MYSLSTAATSFACKDDRYGLAKSPTLATANPQKSHGWALDATAVTSHITTAPFTFVRWRNCPLLAIALTSKQKITQ
ncbi:hypothetical protein GNF10_21185 [Nostoc sp. UCD121]|uniref:hypothetical protein n=1 Tax=unclassified Nostoc TaxID=2593658 RepID=UPI0016248683|nr:MULTISPECIES: hypothetical protein [unclassified Nostoc]MBC1222435.1 hypothetical protein [Nostoc sp. UCD120]MBC1278409.1 hypothetical protein [Nostoc sp. UCD121]MBC1296017.1 hypothetical protein [Nostoc sp. UCD122]